MPAIGSLPGAILTDAEVDRFLAKIDPQLDGCWLWTGAGAPGYGRVNVGGRTRLAHRIAYEHWNGPIPEGFHVDHRCRVRACVCPDHLEAVTQAENNRRAPNGGTAGRWAERTECHKCGGPLSPPRPYERGRRCAPCSRANARQARLRRLGQVAV